ncbi:MAG: lipoprotein-releasing ABC transporter permease subunit [Gammaproteobacteria bacterium]|nr:lipoprotein-releasing ABC transporter permease subunit [Gammaproteobacteria bacterium]MBT8151567.1 lipoprotein-releasing ABC transporter permease subunit [Gammaproteobacteria bacterium]NND38361.1 lipoprotein-releasing ABC transporter permease subunit [Pseudomonadales bacterium]NNM12351.1 lipoprotein-releasing ABC transporter permease subunit [Pseudomonadales bacterium]
MSNLPFVPAVALRYSAPYLNRGLTGFLSFVSLAGLALAVFALVVVTSVMNGFERELQNRMLSLLPHATLSPQGGHARAAALREPLLAQPGIVAVTPHVEGMAMFSANGRFQAAALAGVEMQGEHALPGIAEHLVMGDASGLGEQRYGLVLGYHLARQLGVFPGDRVQLVLPGVRITPMGPLLRQRNFYVQAIFQVGAELDQSTAFTDVDSAARLFANNATVDGVRITVDQQFRANAIVSDAIQALTTQGILSLDLSWQDWRSEHASLYRAVVMEKVMIFVLLLAVVAVASFNVISIILMTVNDKRVDIAVLRTMGASAEQINRLFIFQGATIAAAGTFCGALLGVLVAPNIGKLLQAFERASGWQLFDPEVYFIPYLPSLLRWQDVVIVVFAALAISVMVTLLPARRAARIDPVVALAGAH